MGKAAVKAAKAVNYFNAGTVEFIFDPLLSTYYFLEMNTRLQVEHPITEHVTGIDLVHWQIRAAAGERFMFPQSYFTQRGHAIECRIYAEDPANGFLPSTGKLLQFIEPRGPGIRVDSGFRAGDDVTHFYDPMLAKLIVHAESRETAIQKMQAALREFIVHGVVTNIDFLQDVLSHPDFANGKVSTRWVEENMESDSSLHSKGVLSASREHTLSDTRAVGFPTLIAAALADLTTASRQSKIENPNEPDPYSPWKNPNGFRN
jgi:acetyl/propionyl-CoA carboxylase alpha subunit